MSFVTTTQFKLKEEYGATTLSDTRWKNKYVGMEGVGKSALLASFSSTLRALTKDELEIVDALVNTAPKVSSLTTDEPMEQHKLRLFGEVGATTAFVIAAKHRNGATLVNKADIFDLMKHISSTINMRTCETLVVHMDSFNTPNTVDFFRKLFVRPGGSSLRDYARNIDTDAPYITVFGSGLRILEVARIHDDNEEDRLEKHPEFNHSILHVIHGLRFAKHSLVSLCLSDVGLGYHDEKLQTKEESLVALLCSVFLENNCTLRHLDISNNRLDDADMEQITAALDSLPLHSLDISLNKLLTNITLSRIAKHCEIKELGMAGCTGMDTTAMVGVEILHRMTEKGLEQPGVAPVTYGTTGVLVGDKLTPLTVMSLIMAGKLRPTWSEAITPFIQLNEHGDVNRTPMEPLWTQCPTRDRVQEMNRFECNVVWLKRVESGFEFMCRIMMTIINYEKTVIVMKTMRNTETKETQDFPVETECELLCAFSASIDGIPKCSLSDEPTTKKNARQLYELICDACRMSKIQQFFITGEEYIKRK